MEGLAVVDGNLASSQLDLCHQQNLYLNIQVHYNVWCTNCLIYKTTCRTIIHAELDGSLLWQEHEIRELKMSTHEKWLFMTCHLCAHLDVPLKSLKSVWPREGLVDVQPAIVAPWRSWFAQFAALQDLHFPNNALQDLHFSFCCITKLTLSKHNIARPALWIITKLTFC